jgi:hypothetical protein
MPGSNLATASASIPSTASPTRSSFSPLSALVAVFAGTNPSYTLNELAHTLKVSKARFVLAEQDLLSSMRKAMTSVQIPESHLFVLDAPDEAPPSIPFEMPSSPNSNLTSQSWRPLLYRGTASWTRFDSPTSSKDTARRILLLLWHHRPSQSHADHPPQPNRATHSCIHPQPAALSDLHSTLHSHVPHRHRPADARISAQGRPHRLHHAALRCRKLPEIAC